MSARTEGLVVGASPEDDLSTLGWFFLCVVAVVIYGVQAVGRVGR